MPTPGGRPRPGLATASLLAALGLVAVGAARLGTDPAASAPVGAAGAAAADDPDGGEPVLALPAFTVLDSTYNSGLYTSLRTAPDGLPALSYYDDTNGALRYLRCQDPACADASATVVADDGVTGATGLATSLAYDADGLPVISYYDLGAGAVRVAWCGDPDCRARHHTLVDGAVPDVTRTALTIAPDGRAEVAYAAGPTTNLAGLYLARCDREACTRERLHEPAVGEYVASARQGDDLVVAFRDEAARRLRLASCRPEGCTVSSPDPTVGAGLQPSVTIAPDGTTAVAHLDLAGRGLRLLRCPDPSCADPETAILADTPGTGFFPAVALRGDGAATVAYYDEPSRSLWVATCDDAVCAEVEHNLVDAFGIVGLHTSMLLGEDGAPLIAYHDQTNRQLKVVRCADPTCAAPLEAATLGRAASTFVDVAGRPGLVYRSPQPRDIRVARCLDVACRHVALAPADVRVAVGLHGTGTTTTGGAPVVTFADSGRADLRLGTCDRADCPYLDARDLATTGNVGTFATHSLDGDRLAVAHVDRTRGEVRLVTCTAPACADGRDVAVATVPGGAGELAVRHHQGRPVVAHQDSATGRIHLTTCVDGSCEHRRDAVAVAAAAPLPVALELDQGGRVWLLHRDARSGALALTTCADLDCTAPREVVLSADGVEASLALVRDRPVVSFLQEGRGLVLAHCPDDACADPVEVVLSTREGLTTSLGVGSAGEVVVGTLELGSGAPVLLRCPDPTCREVERIELLVRARR